MIILSRTKKPFNTEQAAKIQAARYKVKNYKIIPYETGYALETEDAVEPPATTSSATESETQTVSEATSGVSESPAEPVKKHRVTTPWKPSSYLDIPKHLQVPGRRYRWCKKDKPGNIDKKTAEGWTIDDELTKKMRRLNSPTIHDGTPLDSTLQVREMVVMWMPEEMAQSRQKYYSDKSASAQKSANDKYRREAKDLAGEYGGGAYGDVKETHN